MNALLQIPTRESRPRWHLIDPDHPGVPATVDEAAGPATDARGRPVPRASSNAVRTGIRVLTRGADTFLADVERLGDVVAYPFPGRPGPSVVISNPAHIKSLLAEPDLAPSATSFSPLRPIIGPDSVLTAVGERHRRQRALLMPQFHGKSVANYTEAIERATAHRIDTLPVGTPIRMSRIGQSITLDVIMSGIFGVADPSSASPAERRLRQAVLRLLFWSTRSAAANLVQLVNLGRPEPSLPLRLILRPVDRSIQDVVDERRRSGGEGHDILSILLSARDDAGVALSDSEIRDELLTLLLAGHETTANTIAWTFERLVRHPQIYARARRAAIDQDEVYLTAVLNESMRSRPVIPIFARQVTVPWRFGAYRVEAGSVVLMSTVLLHHRADLYERPFAFDPERFVGVRPAPNTLMPFGGGNRRCLGANLAMAELRAVVGEFLRRTELETTTATAEPASHRNVTMIPASGGLVTVRAVR